MKIGKATQLTLEGRGVLTLRPNDHVATGGEGSIYRSASTVVKLYTDPAKMVRDGMAEKIKLLANITHPYVVGPQGLVLDGHNNPIGYYMPFAEGEPLSRVFTSDFRQRMAFDDGHAAILVDRMRETVKAAHGHGATLVDANELNWLAQVGGKSGPEPRVLDVDSWAIGRWPATVIMPSIRDWRAKKFDASSDWFAWGIVTFQVFTGIHPYKGMLDGYKPAELERRMKDGVSVFAPGVRLNRAVRDFNCIPSVLLNWYEATFQQGNRGAPPSPFDKAVTAAPTARVLRVVTTASGSLSFSKLFGEPNDPAMRLFPCGVVLLKSGRLFDLASKRFISRATAMECEVVKIGNDWLKADIGTHAQWEFSYINGTSLSEEPLTLQAKGQKLVRYENRLFLVTDQGLGELKLMHLGMKSILSIGQTWGVMINSTRWFDGVGIQDAMGATFLVAPFGENACAQMRIRELDGLKPVAAKAGNRFVSIICLNKSGDYRKIDLTFDRDYKSYSMKEEAAQSPDLNLTILPKGVCASIADDGELIIFVPTNGSVNKVADKGVTTDMILGNWGDKVIYLQNDDVWSLTLKP